MSRIEQFEKMLASGQDGPLLRFSLGNEYLAADEPARAAEHLRVAVSRDPDYSAAWKALGTALERDGEDAAAMAAWQEGIEAAERRGDKQAAKEMRVFCRRIEKRGG
jgi:predicted Zn-dependent protease